SLCHAAGRGDRRRRRLPEPLVPVLALQADPWPRGHGSRRFQAAGGDRGVAWLAVAADRDFAVVVRGGGGGHRLDRAARARSQHSDSLWSVSGGGGVFGIAVGAGADGAVLPHAVGVRQWVRVLSW